LQAKAVTFIQLRCSGSCSCLAALAFLAGFHLLLLFSLQLCSLLLLLLKLGLLFLPQLGTLNLQLFAECHQSGS
jgi:hypothetical protein